MAAYQDRVLAGHSGPRRRPEVVPEESANVCDGEHPFDRQSLRLFAQLRARNHRAAPYAPGTDSKLLRSLWS